MQLTAFPINLTTALRRFLGLCVVQGAIIGKTDGFNLRQSASSAMSADSRKSDSVAGRGNVPDVKIPEHHVKSAGACGPRFKNPWDTYEERSLTHVRVNDGRAFQLTGIPMVQSQAGRTGFPTLEAGVRLLCRQRPVV
jgi:hypothetical protein